MLQLPPRSRDCILGAWQLVHVYNQLPVSLGHVIAFFYFLAKKINVQLDELGLRPFDLLNGHSDHYKNGCKIETSHMVTWVATKLNYGCKSRITVNSTFPIHSFLPLLPKILLAVKRTIDDCCLIFPPTLDNFKNNVLVR